MRAELPSGYNSNDDGTTFKVNGTWKDRGDKCENSRRFSLGQVSGEENRGIDDSYNRITTAGAQIAESFA